MNEALPWVICRPFTPTLRVSELPLGYYFVDPADPVFIPEIARYRGPAYVEESLSGCAAPLPAATVVPDFVQLGDTDPPRVLFLASTDTHVHFMQAIARQFASFLFVVPDPNFRIDTSARDALERFELPFAEIGDATVPEIQAFAPDIALCAADWNPEFASLRRQIDAPIVALQEGPHDWDQLVGRKKSRKYQNADVFFAQGPRTLNYIRPPYFAITGNPKISTFQRVPLPDTPRVFINCNFTYGAWEHARDQWLADVIRVCEELGLEYHVSQHPRDRSQQAKAMPSSTFVVRDQLRACSVVVSRLSSLIYEAVAMGRPAIYYNPHGETAPIFGEDPFLPRPTNRDALRDALRDASTMATDQALAFLEQHAGKVDGGSLNRIVTMLTLIAANRREADAADTIERVEAAYFGRALTTLTNRSQTLEDELLPLRHEKQDLESIIAELRSSRAWMEGEVANLEQRGAWLSEHLTRTQSYASTLERELEALRTRLNEELAALRAQQERELKALQEWHDRDRESLHAWHQSELQAVQAQHATELEQLRVIYHEQHQKVESDYRAVASDLHRLRHDLLLRPFIYTREHVPLWLQRLMPRVLYRRLRQFYRGGSL